MKNYKLLAIPVAVFFLMAFILVKPLTLPAQPGGHSAVESMTPGGMAEALLQMGRFQEAASIFSRLLDENPGNSRASRGLVVASLKGKHLEDAKDRLDELIEKYPNQSSLNLGMGLYYHFSGKQDEAERSLKKSVSLDSKNALALNALAAMYSEKKKPEQALEYVSKAIEVQPDEIIFYRNLWKIKSSAGKQDEFIKEFRHSLKTGPRVKAMNYGRVYAGFLRQQGFRQYEEKNMDATLESMEKMLEVYREMEHKPGIVQGLFSLAILNEEKGNKDNAKRYFKEVLKINPDHIQAREKIKGYE